MTRGKKHDDLQSRLEKQMNELEEAQRETLTKDKYVVKSLKGTGKVFHL